MFCLVAILLVICLAIIDGSVSSAVLMSFTLLGGMALCLSLPKYHRKDGVRLFSVVYCIYVVVAFVSSMSFSNNQYFYVSDSMRYIDSFMGRSSFYYNAGDFYDCYFRFSDTNLLYNAYLNEMSLLMNRYFFGMTVYGLTLCQTAFGIWSAVIMYRIFLRHFDSRLAYRQVLLFALLTPFLLYSSIIIRDIIICFFFLLVYDIIDRKFSIWGVVKLLIIMLLTWGIRLYSGLFISVFIWYYILVYLRKTSLKSFGTILSIVLGVIVISIVAASTLMEQTSEELAKYEELSMERSAGGIVSKMMSLPPGVSHFVIALFSMIKPMPPLSVYVGVDSFSNFSISSLALISGAFWFVVFYSFVILLVFNYKLRRAKFEYIIFFGICCLFLLGNATHPDVRRMLPVFPALFFLYTISKNKLENSNIVKRYSRFLLSTYIVMAFALLLLS